MKQLSNASIKVKDGSGNWNIVPGIAGESAYEIAVRRGYQGTEAQWLNALETERAAAVNDIQTAKANALSDIPQSYQELNDSVDDFKDNLVLIQDSQPSAEDNRLWINSDDTAEVTVPTYEEFSQLSDEIELAEHLYNSTLTANVRWPRFELDVTSGITYTIFISNVIATGTYNKVYVVQGSNDLTGNIQIGASASFTPDGNDPVYLTVRFDTTPSVLPNVVYYFYPAETGFRSVSGSGFIISNNNKAAVCNNDCNSIPNNTVFSVGGDVTLDHDPAFGGFYSIVTIGKTTFRTAGDFQIATKASDGTTKIRTFYNASNGWSSWMQIADALTVSTLSDEINLAFKSGNMSISNSNKATICGGDCNGIPNNTYYGVGGDVELNNAPVANRFYAIATFGKSASRTAGDSQFASDTYNGGVYYRNYINATSGWTAWKKIQEVITDEAEYSGIGMFQRFGVIGDSFASGPVLPGTPDPLNQNFDLSWGQVLARSAGVTCVNYSAGGCGTYRFLDSTNRDYNTHLMGKVLSDISGGNPCGLYLLCLGINDSNSTREFGDKHGGLEYLGSSADINSSDYTQNANSFWGNYGKIIAQLKQLTPDSRIVMCTYCRKNNSAQYAYDEYIQAIQQIAAYFEIPCITLTDDAYFSSNFYMDGLVDNHPTAPLHAGYSKAIERLLSRCIVDNYNYFKTYTGLPET